MPLEPSACLIVSRPSRMHVGRQVVDRKWQRGAFPAAAVQPGPDIVVKPCVRGARGMKRD